jgi:hypothetical protein
MQLRKLLDTETSISLAAKAALEEAQRAAEAAANRYTAELQKLKRDMDHKDEKIRKLELQVGNHGLSA